MSAQPNPAADTVTIEIDGQPYRAKKGEMIIQVADAAGIAIPRFCYHPKLAIAANCRMCLVDVEKAPKPLPACATPVMEGMKVYTKSKRALDAQRNVMEFLLINHPLDCPICDQGGECELQDMAMGYGRSVSRFSERKRVVADEDLGPLVATDMTRCIHCTRCVRFMDEVAGTQELGGMGRGEHTEIGTYVGQPLRSELSGNVIDLCPVGALTNKVFRFRARPWELIARPGIGLHDSLGSNLYWHLRRGEVLRIVPRQNDEINETWLADRDRYSHPGLYAADRLSKPMVMRAGQWHEVEWPEALEYAAAGLRGGGDTPNPLGALIAPNMSCEEGYLLQALVRGLGSDDIDHRLRQLDFADQDALPLAPRLSGTLADFEHAQAVLLIGSNPRLDQPLLGHRLRKAWRRGAKIYAVNPYDHAFHFELEQKLIGHAWSMLSHLLDLAKAARLDSDRAPPAGLAALIDAANPSEAARRIVAGLRAAPQAHVLFGDFAVRHPAASTLRALARYLAEATDSRYDEVSDGANAAGLWRVGAVPHRGPAGIAVERPGRHVRALWSGGVKRVILHGLELPHDVADGQRAVEALRKAEFVVAISAYRAPALERVAHVLLPLAIGPETSGTYVNAAGVAQRVAAAAKAPGESRPGWRILRALGERLGLATGFEFIDESELAARIDAVLAGDRTRPAEWSADPPARPREPGLVLTTLVAPYSGDAVQRRAAALQATVLGGRPELRLHPEDALGLGVGDGGRVRSTEGLELPVAIDRAVPKGSAVVPGGLSETAALPPSGQTLSFTRVGDHD